MKIEEFIKFFDKYTIIEVTRDNGQDMEALYIGEISNLPKNLLDCKIDFKGQRFIYTDLDLSRHVVIEIKNKYKK